MSDAVADLLVRSPVRAHLFHSGPLCGTTTFAARPGRGFLHVLRAGEMSVTHLDPSGRRVERSIEEPSVVLYPRPLEHAFHTAVTAEADFVCATVHFENGGSHPLVATLPAAVVVPLSQVAALRPTLEVLFAEAASPDAAADVIVSRLFEVVFIQLLRWVVQNSAVLDVPAGLLRGLAEPRLTALLVALHTDPAADWTLPTMAERAAMSRSAFASLFRDTVGVAPGAYVTRWRLLAAQEALRSGAQVASAASRAGYASPAAFSRVFLRVNGMSPRAWAKANAADTGS